MTALGTSAVTARSMVVSSVRMKKSLAFLVAHHHIHERDDRHEQDVCHEGGIRQWRFYRQIREVECADSEQDDSGHHAQSQPLLPVPFPKQHGCTIGKGGQWGKGGYKKKYHCAGVLFVSINQYKGTSFFCFSASE